MIVHQAYRFALDPTASQRRALHSHCGAARFAFNWGLRQVERSLQAQHWERRILGGALTEVPWSLPALRREWNQAKAEVAPWWQENSKEAYSSGLDGLARALQAWSESRAGKRAGPPIGFPGFRKRGWRDSCRFTTGAIRVDDARHVSLPRIGKLRTLEATDALTQAGARLLSATISSEADRWFVSFTCQVDRQAKEHNGQMGTLGVDLGVLSLATLSDGSVVAGPKALRSGLRRLRRLSRQHSRKRKRSANRRKSARRLARQHARIGHLRQDHLHKLSTRLAKNHGCLVIEDLHVKGLMASAKGTLLQAGRKVKAKSGLNRALADASFGELRRQLSYKCAWYGSKLIVADRFFASSQFCSGCGSRQKLALSERGYDCLHCGLCLDRDLNAARNLAGWGRLAVAGSTPETQNACRRDVSPHRAADPDEAGTGTVPESAGSTGGRILAGLTPAS